LQSRQHPRADELYKQPDVTPRSDCTPTTWQGVFANGSRFVQVYSAPYILPMLMSSLDSGISALQPLALFACQLALAPTSATPRPQEIREDPDIMRIISKAVSEDSPLPDDVVFKIRALFSTSDAVAADPGLGGPRIDCDAVLQWPGGRHGNDHVDFRTINVVPTVEELHHKMPFLPLMDKSDQFLAGQVRCDPMSRLLSLCSMHARHALVPDSAAQHGSCARKRATCATSRLNKCKKCMHGYWPRLLEVSFEPCDRIRHRRRATG
jgi:hypothetical protein